MNGNDAIEFLKEERDMEEQSNIERYDMCIDAIIEAKNLGLHEIHINTLIRETGVNRIDIY